MFKFLKEKLGNVVKKLSREVDEDKEELKAEELTDKQKEEIIEEAQEIQQEEVEDKEETKAEPVEEKQEPKEEKAEPVEDKEEAKQEPEHKEETPEQLEEEKLEQEPIDQSGKLEEPVHGDTEESKDEDIEQLEEVEDLQEKPEKNMNEVHDSSEKVSEKKKGFFSKLFSKKEELEETTPEQEEESTDEKSFEEFSEETKKPEEKIEQALEEQVEEAKEPIEPEIIKKDSEKKEEKEILVKELKADKDTKETVVIEKPASKEEVVEEKKEENLNEVQDSSEKVSEKKKGFFGKVSDTFTKIQLSEKKFEELFWDLEVALLEGNVAVEVIELIKKDLKEELTTGKISRKNVSEIIQDTLKSTIDKVLTVPTINLEDAIRKKNKEGEPYIIAVIGINGAGKTTAIAKMTYRLKKEGFSIVWAAADTFRAAAIQQLEEHANKLDVKMIKHDYNSDPAAVAFDAVKHAKAKNLNVVMIDTAGRMHSNDNLMQELRKLIKVNNPDMKIYVGESITGNDCVQQAKIYDEQIGIDGIILTKADTDEKGGAAISISHVTGKPILFLGTGQTYDDLEPFDKYKIMESLGL